jgi:hypothetical protein
MERMRLGVFERARLIAGAQPSSTWLFTAALIFSFFGILGILASISLFPQRPPKEGMSHPAISWPRVSFGVFPAFLVFDFRLLVICSGERASE